MFFDLHVGRLTEPLTCRSWDKASILRRLCARIASLQGHGLSVSDPVFIHYGNTPEFFIDLLAIWNLGGIAIPVDPQLTGFEVDILARVAKTRLSLWLGSPDGPTAKGLSDLGTEILDSSEVSEGDAAPPPGIHPRVLFFAGRPRPGVVHLRHHRKSQGGCPYPQVAACALGDPAAIARVADVSPVPMPPSDAHGARIGLQVPFSLAFRPGSFHLARLPTGCDPSTRDRPGRDPAISMRSPSGTNRRSTFARSDSKTRSLERTWRSHWS